MKVRFFASALFLSCLIGLCSIGAAAFADTSSSTQAAIQAQINAHSQQIDSLNQEISQYQKQLNAVTAQKQTLQSAIKTIDLTKAQTTAQINVTQNKLSATDLRIQQLGQQIQTKQQIIEMDKNAIAASLREISANDGVSPVIAVLSSDTLVNAWLAVDTQTMVNAALHGHITELADVKTQLAGQQQEASSTKQQLVQLDTTLTTQKGQLEATEQSKQQLLAVTKNTESTYQQLLAQKKAQEKTMENELSDLAKQLKSVTAAEIPHSGQGILAWPFSDSVMENCKGKSGALGNIFCITQYFGNTAFATANASVYNGMGHDGLDIGVPVGTPVEAALSGTVLATGNTDLASNKGQQCLSFGKWVMIKHANGLNTMYAHLSQIGVSAGQAVSTGDVIGYSGMTGYATGPHLHFGVYASAGVKIMTLGQYRGASTPCQNATMPVSPTNGYLNPLSYL